MAPFPPSTGESAPLSEDTRPGSWPRRRAAPLPWSALFWGVGLIGVGVLLLLPWMLDRAAQREPLNVRLRIDGRETPLQTQAQTVGGLLEEQGLLLDASDLIAPDVATTLEPEMLVEIVRARLVSLTVDGTTRVLRTRLENPAAILASAEITLAAADRVYLDGTLVEASRLATWPIPVQEITLVRGVELMIQDGETLTALHTTRTTIAEALFEAGITLFAADTILPDANTPVQPGMRVVIRRAVPVTFLVDGARTETRTTAALVGEALAEAGIALVGLDYVVPAETDPVIGGMAIRVLRVREAIVTEEERLAYDTIYQADPALGLDERVIMQAGQEGLVVREFRARFENEVEIRRTLEGETRVREAAPQVIHYGTNIALNSLPTPEGPVQYWRRLRVYATSYHPAALGGDNVTATGRLLERGVVGIDPRLIPYDTLLYVEGYGVGVAADTGAPRSHSYWIDLGYSDADYVHWARWVDVYLLTPVPQNVTYLLPPHPQGG